ncbi:hypothetical protein [Robertmurraya massiliosenegalensis]|uniref:hypothetical protein n=1 Tax=Robertmurraya massiliosenegalensis TaxID=1287657 RepID=UPI0002F6C851|nr:hypothetical protein [Robertmurraya massiliosenegalensis]
MNCPICRTAVLEVAGEICLDYIKPIELTLLFGISQNETNYKLFIYICSVDKCNYTKIEASREFLTHVKKEKKKSYTKDIQKRTESHSKKYIELANQT